MTLRELDDISLISKNPHTSKQYTTREEPTSVSIRKLIANLKLTCRMVSKFLYHMTSRLRVK